eukprot:1627654-Pyramimonas_sp.AAC.1
MRAVPLGLGGLTNNGAAKNIVGWWTAHAGGATGFFPWSSLRGHEALYGVVADAIGRTHWDHRASSPWGHES